ncbi:PIG-L deacetylase family protein [Litoreibacter janthinus]|uniref:N-acetylglucosaminyl deacetylase, LmbE family n=1 Tax=Litoreibacter janthinus TaxID=670154 RepID=A0A1I6ID13_9RHOB|nr:PIG-L family deacetylase [Litoreibacter janthinus]SFR64622.1 N-acetylglucosaminyl deacetylase, LmbE family [Litoreibacter janthinus]
MSLFSKGAGIGRKALLLSAHTDDCEIGMGGTIARLIEAGYEIRWLVFCNAWQSLPEGLEKDTLIHEQKAAAKALGIPQENLEIFDIPVRLFPQYRQEILELLVKEGRATQPDLVFCPSLQDRHQDHLTLAQESERAFKRKTLLGYLLPWNISHAIHNCHVEISESQYDTKMAGLECYVSQSHRQYFQGDAVRTILKSNGLTSGMAMSEAFEVIRLNQPL